VRKPVLLQDRSEIGLGYIVRKGAVSEDASGITHGCKQLVPLNDALCQWLDFLACDPLCETGEQNTSADSVDLFTYNAASLDWHTKIKPKLEKQLVKNVRLSTTRTQVLNRFN